jgi:prepilin-type processing-associated H-X9-DG protein
MERLWKKKKKKKRDCLCNVAWVDGNAEAGALVVGEAVYKGVHIPCGEVVRKREAGADFGGDLRDRL